MTRGAPREVWTPRDTWNARAHRFAWAGWLLVVAGVVALIPAGGSPVDAEDAPSVALTVLVVVPLVLAAAAALLVATGPWVRGRVAVVAAALLCVLGAVGQAVTFALLTFPGARSSLDGMSWEGTEALAASPGVLAAAGLLVLFLLGWAHRAPGEAWHGNPRAVFVPIAAGLALASVIAWVLNMSLSIDALARIDVMAPVGLLAGVSLVLAGRRRTTTS